MSSVFPWIAVRRCQAGQSTSQTHAALRVSVLRSSWLWPGAEARPSEAVGGHSHRLRCADTRDARKAPPDFRTSLSSRIVRPTLASAASGPIRRAATMDGPLVSSKHRQADGGRSVRRNGPSRNAVVTACVRVGRMLGAPVSRSADVRYGRGGAGRLQTPKPAGVAVVSAGVGSSASAANGLRRPLRPRARAVASRRGAGGRQVPRVRCPRTRLRAHPLRRLCARVPVGLLLQVPVLPPEVPRQATRDPDARADTTLLAPVPHRRAVLTILKRLRADCLVSPPPAQSKIRLDNKSCQ